MERRVGRNCSGNLRMLLQGFSIESKSHVLNEVHFEILLTLQSCAVIFLEPVAHVARLKVW